MDSNRFDHLARAIGDTTTRRAAIAKLGVGSAAALLAVFGWEDAGAACAKLGKKCGKGKKCCQGTKCSGGKCKCKRGPVCGGKCCPSGTTCQGGKCVAKQANECASSGDCRDGAICIDNLCVSVQGTCDSTDDHCAVEESLCNLGGASPCFCLQRFGGGAACFSEFVPDAQCGGCRNDADCDAIEAGSICLSPSKNGCPCEANEGICGRPCLAD